MTEPEKEDKIYDDELAAARRKIAIDKQLKQDEVDKKNLEKNKVRPWAYLIILIAVVWFIVSSSDSNEETYTTLKPSTTNPEIKIIKSTDDDGYKSFVVFYDNLKVDKADIQKHAKQMPWRTGRSTIACYFDDKSKIPDISKVKGLAIDELQESGYHRYCFFKFPNGNSNLISNSEYGVKREPL